MIKSWSPAIIAKLLELEGKKALRAEIDVQVRKCVEPMIQEAVDNFCKAFEVRVESFHDIYRYKDNLEISVVNRTQK